MHDEATANFDRWFGASKLVKEDGQAMVVYHGTNADFQIFRPSTDEESSLGAGIYLTSSASQASDYAIDNAEFYDGAPSVMPVYARLENPLVGRSEDDILAAIAKITDADLWDEIRRDLMAAGVDGIWQKYPDGSDQIVVFDPGQVKSALGNSGRYATDSHDITDRIEAAERAQNYLSTIGSKTAAPHA